MDYQEVDLEHYARRAHFVHFRAMQFPYFSLTVPMDVSSVRQYCCEKGCSFYLTFMHLVALAANEIPEMRQRIHGETIREYAFCNTSHVELLDNGTYTYCTLEHDMPMDEYLQKAVQAREACRHKQVLAEDEEVESLLFISSLPWIYYTQLTQPGGGGGESNPQITWGKFVQDGQEKWMMPVTVQVHHALVDGLHVSRFYESLIERIRLLNQENGGRTI